MKRLVLLSLAALMLAATVFAPVAMAQEPGDVDIQSGFAPNVAFEPKGWVLNQNLCRGVVAAAPSIPYEEIDVEIRRLIRLANRFPGIRTTGSCAGHKPEQEAEIDFVVESQEAVATLLGALPFVGWRGGIANNFPHTKTIYVNVYPRETGCPLYKLRLGASPFYVQRQLIGEVEKALASYLSSPK
jgi:hypothetical protein